jgi:hypothetical protein
MRRSGGGDRGGEAMVIGGRVVDLAGDAQVPLILPRHQGDFDSIVRIERLLQRIGLRFSHFG